MEADNEYVIRGNSAIMKCETPSYLSDFLYVDLWKDTEGNVFYPNNTDEGHLSSRNALKILSNSPIYFYYY